MTERHAIVRVRHALRMRRLQVSRVRQLTPHMVRVTLVGPDLDGFVSAAPDDHVKVFFPVADGALNLPTLGPEGPVYPEGVEPSPSRDYTPRRYDAAAGELDIDFVLHGEGPASSWAERAKPGDMLGVGGPRGSMVVPDDYDHYVLVGDATALPAIGRWLEQMRPDAKATVLVEVPSLDDRQALARDAQWFVTGTSPGLDEALASLPIPEGDTFWWVAVESSRARALRSLLVEQRGIDKDWVKATGYWQADAL
ncbi:siderophore-interacting protein [Luteibacter jiangsuensis]|uniref:Siderophore-interacting protein n=1 Tax=Luteibacter jiangsuensis TaxID=637577 RepID=A0ABX0Q5X5_9GAMM|nr:siderophore-interacting protein [Luteibacter jiangsuensis]NID05929.1 siderophore-interacting protein [Luteibacter jiangsuensis]